jgi:hypothetical protein
LQNYHLEKSSEDQPIVALLGGSTIRETIFDLEYFEENFVSNNQSVPFYDFTTSGQTMSLSHNIAENILCGRNGIVVIAANKGRPVGNLKITLEDKNNIEFFDEWVAPGHINNSTNRAYLYKVFINDVVPVDAIIKNAYRHLINLFINTPEYYKSRSLSFNKTIYRHHYTSTNISTEKNITKLLEKEKYPRPNVIKNQLIFYERLENFIVEMNSCSALKILLVIPGIHPRLREDQMLAKKFKKHKAALQKFQKYTNVHLLDLNELHYFNHDDFADLVHLRSVNAMLTSSSILFNNLLKLLRT